MARGVGFPADAPLADVRCRFQEKRRNAAGKNLKPNSIQIAPIALGLVAALMTLSGCYRRAPAPRGDYLLSIRIDGGRGFSSAAPFTSIVSERGTGVIYTYSLVDGTSRRSFHFTRQQFEELSRSLASVRPVKGVVRSNCLEGRIDVPGANVTWTTSSGATQQLLYDYGCDPGDGLLRRVGWALGLLPGREAHETGVTLRRAALLLPRPSTP